MRAYKYILVHEHRFGADVRTFMSSEPDLEVEYWGESMLDEAEEDEDGVPVDPQIDPITQAILDGLNIDFEVRMEEGFTIKRADTDPPFIEIPKELKNKK